MVTRKLKSIRTQLQPQVQAIEALGKDQAEQIIKDVTNGKHHLSGDRIEAYADRLRFYAEGGSVDIGKVRERWGLMREDWEEHYEHANRQI